MRPVAYEGKACYVHGGRSPRGAASPQFKHGRYSAHIPTQLAAKYEEALQDDERLRLWDEIALVDARLAELLETLDKGESGQLWGRLRDARAGFLAALQEEDRQARDNAVREMVSLIERGAADWERWKEIADFLERRRRLVESEQKRLVAMQQMITAEQAMTLLAVLTRSLVELGNEYVDERRRNAYFAAIQHELDLFAGQGVRAARLTG